MKDLLFVIAVALGTVIAVRRLVPAERRTQLRERLAQVPATMMERCMESLPEDSPPKVMTSAMRRFEEQNDELLRLIREQNKFLRKQTAILEAASAGESQS
jgi:hypothetical protein